MVRGASMEVLTPDQSRTKARRKAITRRGMSSIVASSGFSLVCGGALRASTLERGETHRWQASPNTATAHKLGRMVHFMLTRGEAFVDQGQEHYEEQQRQRNIAALIRRRIANAMALKCAPQPPA